MKIARSTTRPPSRRPASRRAPARSRRRAGCPRRPGDARPQSPRPPSRIPGRRPRRRPGRLATPAPGAARPRAGRRARWPRCGGLGPPAAWSALRGRRRSPPRHRPATARPRRRCVPAPVHRRGSSARATFSATDRAVRAARGRSGGWHAIAPRSAHDRGSPGSTLRSRVARSPRRMARRASERDHGRVVRTQHRRRHVERETVLGGHLGQCLAQPSVGRHAAADDEVP